MRFQPNTVVSICKRREDETMVQPNLAVTPSKMMKMAEHGVAISSDLNSSNFVDGDKNPSWDIPLERLRGIDMADLWQTRQAIKSKIKNSHLNDVAKYG